MKKQQRLAPDTIFTHIFYNKQNARKQNSIFVQKKTNLQLDKPFDRNADARFKEKCDFCNNYTWISIV